MNTTYTQPGSVWISEGGEVVCGTRRGGSYLQNAVAAGKGPRIITPSEDDWLYHSPETAAEYELTCEYCPPAPNLSQETTATEER